ncbi:MAG: magnesium/cobalt transporter CorA [Saprospiraceae bacterium]|nr:magnesium/cobalt transporter CorA [Saprospiraceae bacterium]
MGKKKQKTKLRKRGLPPGTLVYTGDRDAHPAHVLTIAYNEIDYTEINGFDDAFLLQHKEFVRWIDVRGLTDTTLIEKIGHEFTIHPLALEDVLNTGQRAKLDEYENGLFFSLPNLRFDHDNLEIIAEQVSIFVGNRFVLSFQEDPDDTFAFIRNRCSESIGRLRKKSSDYLAYSLVDNIVDGYYLVLDDIENHLGQLEENLHTNGANPVSKARIFELKRVVNQLRQRLLPLRDAVTRFYRTDSELIDDANRLYLRDVVDHVAQLIDGVDNEREILAGIEALFHAEASNRLNHSMRLLTVISTIFIPLTFIVGIYGMNFDNMPELRQPNGYFIVLGIMGCLMVGMMAYFKVKKWL